MKKHVMTTHYVAITAFILGWWFLAFKDSVPNRITQVTHHQAFPIKLLVPGKTFFSIDKDLLKRALSGDFNQMAEFISEWDIDAQILQAEDVKEIKRLASADFLRSKVMMRNIHDLKKKTDLQMPELKITQSSYSNSFSLKAGKKSRFLPQTYAAASLLLAIAPLDQIVALPKHFREQKMLFPDIVTDKIPLDIDRYNREKLFLTKPDIAFVAQYSHPATVQALQNQGTLLYTMKDLISLETLEEELMKLGMMTEYPHQAEMLKIFIEAALLAIDNRQRLIIEHLKQTKAPLPSILVLDYHHTFSIPSKETLNGKILERLNTFDVRSSVRHDLKSNFSVSIDKEHLALLDPSCLIIITENDAGLKSEMQRDLALSSLKAVKNGNVFFVSEAIHHSPTQYAILAYHELVGLLEKLL